MNGQIAGDLALMNLPKYASKIELKKQYHKFAKLYHPDVLKIENEKQKLIAEERFK